jgi:hypothetical protein
MEDAYQLGHEWLEDFTAKRKKLEKAADRRHGVRALERAYNRYPISSTKSKGQSLTRRLMGSPVSL